MPAIPTATAQAPKSIATVQPQVQLLPAHAELPKLTGLTPASFVEPGAAGKAIDEFFLNYQKIAGLDAVIHVEVGGKTVLDKAYGYANSPQNKAMTTDTRFRIYHLSGPFTAAAVLMLQEAGKLKVEDPVCKYITDCPAAWKDVTIRHLLTHTSGLDDFSKLSGAATWAHQPLSLNEMLHKIWAQSLTATPGSCWQYSPGDFLAASAIIEKVSGMSYEAYVKQAVLDPLGLKNTGLSDANAILATPNAGVPQINVTPENTYGAMGLYSTAGDLARWAHALMGDGSLPKTVRDQMLADQLHFGQNLAQDGWYGYGLGGAVNHGHLEWGDTAAALGFMGTLYFEPDSGLVVVALFNTGKVDMQTLLTAMEKKLFAG